MSVQGCGGVDFAHWAAHIIWPKLYQRINGVTFCGPGSGVEQRTLLDKASYSPE